jgi:hypothetical protein
MPRAVLVLVLAIAACAAPAAPTGPSNRPAGDPAGADRDARALALLHALAAALAADRPLGELVDARDGAWIWNQPGAIVSPSLHVAPGDRRRPSEIIAAADWPAGAKRGWAAGAAAALEHGLAVVDVDGEPGKADYYVDCADPQLPPARRALLRTRAIDLGREQAGLADSPAAGLTAPLGFSFRTGTTMVYLSERGGALAIAHLLVWFPCDA